MQRIVWKEAYNIGIDVIDTQHKTLIELINDLYTANASGSAHLIIESVFTKMSDYALYHFSEEENMMKQYGYPKLAEHISEHDDFRNRIKQLKSEGKSGNIILSLKTIDYLKDWTINHILGTDREFSDYIRHAETDD